MSLPAIHRRRFLATASAALAAAGAGGRTIAVEKALDQPDDPTGFLGRRSPVFARHFLASSSSPLATRVGLRVLEDGGNAFDAAVAMAGMMAVVEPMMSGLGGDTMILAWSAKERRVFGLNGSGRAPSGASLERIGDRPMMPEHGASSVTIPGAVDGWCRLLERFGSRSLSRLWEPAVAAAREGYPVGESIAGMWAVASPLLPKYATPHLLKVLLPAGKPPVPGQLVRFPQLADTLEQVARGGREAFYVGPVAKAIADTLSAGGVPTAIADVAKQEAAWVEPLSVRYRGRDVLGLPPNSQSAVALIALGILEGYDVADMGESDRLHHAIEALRLGFTFAIDEVGEPSDAMLENVRRMLTADVLAELRGRITARATAPVRPHGGNTSDTTYLCAIDAEGNAVSLMSSICGMFGSGLLAGDTGVILNNRASQFSSRRGHPNALAPGRRPRHTILPGMVLRDGEPEYLLGCIGLNNHPQGQVQLLIDALDLGMNPQEACDAPRFRVVMNTDEVQLDETFPEQIGKELAARGHRLGDSQAFKGATQMLRIHQGTRRGTGGVGPCLESGVDHRLDGVALGW
ncbi:MAG: gamma-glutamyltransferase family protein [Planctomycetia bacterium]|jgi:gamma-glutamyltranspeptidase/glutathione hydrolase